MQLVKEHFPEAESYADIYHKYNLLTKKVKTQSHTDTHVPKFYGKIQMLNIAGFIWWWWWWWFTDGDGPWLLPQWRGAGSFQKDRSLFVPLSQFQHFVSIWFSFSRDEKQNTYVLAERNFSSSGGENNYTATVDVVMKQIRCIFLAVVACCPHSKVMLSKFEQNFMIDLCLNVNKVHSADETLLICVQKWAKQNK